MVKFIGKALTVFVLTAAVLSLAAAFDLATGAIGADRAGALAVGVVVLAGAATAVVTPVAVLAAALADAKIRRDRLAGLRRVRAMGGRLCRGQRPIRTRPGRLRVAYNRFRANPIPVLDACFGLLLPLAALACGVLLGLNADTAGEGFYAGFLTALNGALVASYGLRRFDGDE